MAVPNGSGDASNDAAQTEPEGWTWIIGATKWHYIIGRISICGRWMLPFGVGELQPGNDDSPDNCATCKRKLKERQKKLQNGTTIDKERS